MYIIVKRPRSTGAKLVAGQGLIEHPTQFAAISEANRLAEAYPGDEFYVMSPVFRCHGNTVVIGTMMAAK